MGYRIRRQAVREALSREQKRQWAEIQNLPCLWAEAVLQEWTRGTMPKSKVQVEDNKTADTGLVRNG